MSKTTSPLLLASVFTLLSLAGCQKEPQTIVANGPADPQAEALKNAPPVALPPSIASSKAYRCADNSLIYVDFMSDQKTANLHIKKGGTPIVLTASDAGKPFEGSGYSLSGSGGTVNYGKPGGGKQSCTG